MLLVFPLLANSQDTPLGKLFDKYVEKPGFSTTEIRTSEVSFEWEDEEKTDHIRKVLDEIEGIRILNIKEDAVSPEDAADKFYGDIRKAIDKEDYVEVITVSDGEDDVRLYFLKDGALLQEAALVIRNGVKVTLITVTGDIDPAMLMQKETISGLNSLKDFYAKDKNCGEESK